MEKTISEQCKLIGEHPNSSFFYEWLESVDEPVTENKKHRHLSEKKASREFAIEQISDWIVKHHIDEKRIKRLKKKREEILDKYGFEEYVKKQTLLPTVDKTKKGNGTEIILAEYLQETTKLNLLVYRLRYNTNVNQAMKGDDVLLLNRENLYEKVIVGESKFRTTPSKAVIEEVTKEFAKEMRLPLSVTFLAQKMSDFGDEDLAESLEDLNVTLHDGKVPIISVGFLLSNHNTNTNVNRHLVSNNPNFVFVSLGIEKPEELIAMSFDLAEEKLKRGNDE
ncbi:Hachiman antiphage defense system protein HamA [Cytobacillus sp. FSL R5-0596]|uniref:Hachiman antiphage defense system protein HamA n=1 Tax=Cytobacillus sp. FSL R5-0596 TaxID=2954696 RepID=UPI0030FCEA07